MVQDYLDTTQQRNDQVVQLLEILIKDWLRTRQLSVVPSVTSPTVKIAKVAFLEEWCSAVKEAHDSHLFSDTVSVTLLTLCQNVKQFASTRHPSVTEAAQGGRSYHHSDGEKRAFFPFADPL